MYKSPYTISIWDTNTSPETKICDIGSDTMTTSARALEPKFVRNINGKTTFQFKMYKDCYDPEVGKFSNPYLPKLINERVVKVNWEGDWFDFVIKNIQEDSAAKSYTFQCESWLVQELSKQGFNLEFDEKLENNQGFIDDLTAKVLKNTNWIADPSNEAIGLEYNKEAVYEVSFQNIEFTALNLPDFVETSIQGGIGLIFFSCISGLSTSGGQTVLQFVWTGSNDPAREPNSMMVKDSEQYNYQVMATYTYSNGYYTFEIPSAQEGEESITFDISIPLGVSSEYRAKKLINSLKSVYDPITDKYCYVLLPKTTQNEQLYTVEGHNPLYIELNGTLYPIYLVGSSSSLDPSHQYYEFKDTQTNFAKYVQNLIANPSTFTDSTGWRIVATDGEENPTYSADELIPTVNCETVTSYLNIPNTDVNSWIFNMSIRSSRNFIDRFIYGETYILRLKVQSKDDASDPYQYVAPPFTDIKISRYVDYKTYFPSDESDAIYFTASSEEETWIQDSDTNFYYLELKCVQPLSLEAVTDAQIGLFFKNDNGSSYVRIEEAQLFKKVMNDGGTDFIRPAEFEASGVLKEKYYVYDHTDAKDNNETTKEEITSWYYGGDDMIAEDSEDFRYLTTEFMKFRTITAKESNRFNLLQTIAEKFECWCIIYATHAIDGTITQRHVKFVETVGEDQNIGFIYGLDLKTVKRTVDSKQIVTKTIVKANSNKYGENGFCTIARANENFPKVNYVFDFDYYINQGLLDKGALNVALYSVDEDTSVRPDTETEWPEHTPVGYFQKLHIFNTAYDNAANGYEKYKLQYDNLGAYLKVFKSYQENALSEKYKYMLDLFNLGKFVPDNIYDEGEMESTLQDLWDDRLDTTTAVGQWYRDFVRNRTEGVRDAASVNAWKFDDGVVKAIEAETKYEDQINSITATIDELEREISDLESDMEYYVGLIGSADLQFQKLYGQFIQEGTWSSEDYYNDTSYYLDALDVAYTSARPRITYSIDVLRLNALPEFKNKVFNLGDIAYVEDTEFFGYTTVGTVKTPYHEKVVLTELTQNFDDPSKDQFKVQNYRTQFEDLFQRITASVQSLQWNEADYGRAVNAVEKDETINTDILQASFNTAQDLVRNSLNNAILQDATGISIVNQDDPSKQSHINAEGFFVSTDGGTKWRNAISAEGIATELLTAGAIDTTRISLKDGNYEAFRWDNTGLNAYKTLSQGYGVEYGTFVRFDKWGIYGRTGQTNFAPTTESDIWNDSNNKFALTWSGLNITTQNGLNSVIAGAVPNGSTGTDFGFSITKNTISNDGTITNRQKVFYASSSGDLTLEGSIKASDGYIGGSNGFTIGTGNLYTLYTSQSVTKYSGIHNNGTSTIASTPIFYAGADDTSGTNAKFWVAADGTLHATGADISGTITANAIEIKDSTSSTDYLLRAYTDSGNRGHVSIGGFTVNDYSIYQAKPTTNNQYYLVGISNYGTNAANHRFAAGLISNDGSGAWSEAAFRVTMDGSVYATKGQIGGFTIDSNHIYSGYKNSQQTNIYFGMRRNATNVGDNQILFFAGATGTIDPTSANFYVTSSGTLFCNSVTIAGTIASGGTLKAGSNFTVDAVGNMTATSATISGAISAGGSLTAGAITLKNNILDITSTSGSIRFNNEKILSIHTWNNSTYYLACGFEGYNYIRFFNNKTIAPILAIKGTQYTLATYTSGGRTYLILT